MVKMNAQFCVYIVTKDADLAFGSNTRILAINMTHIRQLGISCVRKYVKSRNEFRRMMRGMPEFVPLPKTSVKAVMLSCRLSASIW